MAKLTKVFDDIRVSIFAFLATSQKKNMEIFFFLAHCPLNYPLLLLSPDSFASLDFSELYNMVELIVLQQGP